MRRLGKAQPFSREETIQDHHLSSPMGTLSTLLQSENSRYDKESQKKKAGISKMPKRRISLNDLMAKDQLERD